MVVRFLTGRFIWEYSAEERLYVHHCCIGIGDDDHDNGGSDVLLEILDTEAKVRSVKLGSTQFRSSDFDRSIDDHRSFHQLTHFERTMHND